MPSSARLPRMATNPRGFPDSNRAPTTPISPSGPTLRTMKRREKLRNCTIRTVNMSISIAGGMGTGPADSVTDDRGRVHGHPWLRVADASLFPDSLEINPYLTLMALADRVAEGLLADFGKGAP